MTALDAIAISLCWLALAQHAPTPEKVLEALNRASDALAKIQGGK